MRFKTLGTTGVEVSRICCGTGSFGGDADADTSRAIYKRCRDAGVNFFDCANSYPKTQPGLSEQILGQLMEGERDQLVITTKVYNRVGPDRNDRGHSRRHMVKAVEDSLRRLGTDRIDVYYLHLYDDRVPMEETLRVLEDLLRDGKILYAGVSNWAAWQVATALGIEELRNWQKLACIQPMYNLAKRQAEVELFPLALARGLGVVSYGPIGGGLLSGKYGRNRRPEAGRIMERAEYVKRYGEDFYFDLAERFTEKCNAWGYHPTTVAVAWAMANEAVSAPIVGSRKVEQLEASLAAADLVIDSEWYEEISNLSPAPPPPTDRSEERG